MEHLQIQVMKKFCYAVLKNESNWESLMERYRSWPFGSKLKRIHQPIDCCSETYRFHKKKKVKFGENIKKQTVLFFHSGWTHYGDCMGKWKYEHSPGTNV